MTETIHYFEGVLYVRKYQKANRLHECSCCNTVIGRGEEYYSEFIVEPGHQQFLKFHETCYCRAAA